MRVPEEADRDFVAGCYIVRDQEILLIDHKKLGVWLPPGGHVDDGETPDETARREALEETGWETELLEETCLYEDRFDSRDIPQPFNINLHRVRDSHWHCDFQYIARPVEKREATHNHEHDGQKWFSLEYLEEIDVPENVKSSVKKALEIVE